jgi:hypothetical protein
VRTGEEEERQKAKIKRQKSKVEEGKVLEGIGRH